MKRISNLLLIILLVTAGCNNNSPDITEETERPTNKVAISGSSTITPIIAELAQAFSEKNGDIEFVISESNSTKGISDLHNNSIDIAMSSVKFTDVNKKNKTIIYKQICKDAIVPVVSEPVYDYVKAISLKELKMIFTGEITNWKEFRGKDTPIFLVDKNSGSGTRKVYMNQLFGANGSSKLFGIDTVAKNTKQQIDFIEHSTNAISMLPFGLITENCKGLSIITEKGMVEPIKENIDNGSYPIIRPLYMVYTDKATANTKAFIEFVNSKEGRILLEKQGCSVSKN